MKAAYIEVSANVRYWEYAEIDGIPDEAGAIPFRRGESWKPIINLQTGIIKGWPEGVTASIHYKVCDAGEYWLQDAHGQRFGKWRGYYVPDDILCVGDTGYGDYIIFKVGAGGQIADWSAPTLVPDEWLPVAAPKLGEQEGGEENG